MNKLFPSHVHRHMPNGCEVDVTIPEDFPPEALMEFIEAFINVIYYASYDSPTSIIVVVFVCVG